MILILLMRSRGANASHASVVGEDYYYLKLGLPLGIFFTTG